MRAPHQQLLVLLLLTSCLGYRIHERDSQWIAKTILELEEFTLLSPYDAETTELWVPPLRGQYARCAALFPVSPSRELEVRLIPVPVEESDGSVLGDLRVVLHAHSGHVGGYHKIGTLGTRTVSSIGIYVPETHMRIALLQKMSGFRHELGHYFMSEVGLGQPTWLSEGYAESVQHEEIGAGTIRLSRVTRAGLEQESRLPTAGAIQRLIAWENEDVTELILQDDLSPEGRQRLDLYYHHSHLLVLFLLGRTGNGELIDRLRAIAALTPEELHQLEPEWIDWCREQTGR